MERFDNFSDADNYTLEEITVAGYKATRMSYSDDITWSMETLIEFGDDSNKYKGVRVNVSSYDINYEDCTTEVIEAIIASVSVK